MPIRTIASTDIAMCQHLEMENLKLAIQNCVMDLQYKNQMNIHKISLTFKDMIYIQILRQQMLCEMETVSAMRLLKLLRTTIVKKHRNGYVVLLSRN